MKINSYFTTLFLKIIGIITMTLDHMVKIIDYYNLSIFDEKTLILFNIIGRISFPIFAFLIIEGMIHTRNKLFYLSRLFILSIGLDLFFYLYSSNYWGNPITTLFLGSLFIYFIEHKNKFIKLLSIVPIAYTMLIAFEIIPLLSMYDLYGFITILLFYFAYQINKILAEKIALIYNIDEKEFFNEYSFKIRKLVSILLFLIFTILVWFINPTYNNKNIFIDDPTIQLYSIFSIFPLLIYNGKKGYNKKWIQIIFYLYFPIHLCILYLLLVVL